MKEITNPNLKIGGFELWVYEREFPESEDYWDGNWLIVKARCTGHSAMVETTGPIIRVSELSKLLEESKQIMVSLSGEADSECMEPYLNLKIIMLHKGQCELHVFITPDNRYQQHSFIFDLDQSYLVSFIKDLEQIMLSYPVRGKLKS